jgi:hypothetical protein
MVRSLKKGKGEFWPFWVRRTSEENRGQKEDDISLLVSNFWKVETEKSYFLKF